VARVGGRKDKGELRELPSGFAAEGQTSRLILCQEHVELVSTVRAMTSLSFDPVANSRLSIRLGSRFSAETDSRPLSTCWLAVQLYIPR
jgi:hypothetical protein